MPTTVTPTLDRETVERLSAGFHRCFSDFEADEDLFASDTLFDMWPPLWRFQVQGPGDAFTAQLASIAEGPSEIEVIRTVPTATGFVTEHVETQHAPDGDVVARRLCTCVRWPTAA